MARDSTPIYEYDSDEPGKKFWEKTKKEPFVPIGILGMLGMIGYGAYSFKSRGTMKPSIFLMHLRVKAQSMVVGAMALGVTYSLIRDHYFKKQDT